MKILITGGHVTPALALLEQLDTHSIVFVGRKYVPGSSTKLSFEYEEITARNIPFIDLQTGKLTRAYTIKALKDFLKIPAGFRSAYSILKHEKPHVVLTFGSYLAVPVAFWAWMFGVPVYVHEQTIHPGLANRIVGKFAKKIFISFKESEQFFDTSKTVLTGNPIRQSVFQTYGKSFVFAKTRPVIYVTGGSLGSHSINLHIKNILPQLLKKYTVIHQTGDTDEFDDFAELKKIKDPNYYVRKHIPYNEIGFVYSVADIVVSRAGANTFFEMIALRKPAVLIPLPWSAGQEQMAHAELFRSSGVGELFLQNKPSEELYLLIDKVYEKRVEYSSHFNALQKIYAKDPTGTILREILAK